MIKVVKTASPAAKAVLRQATALHPRRRTASDGLLPSAAHQKQNPNSDHNSGLGVDLTHDTTHGIDCKDIFERLKTDKRVKYLIHNGLIWSKDRAKEGNRKYDGANSHPHHLHISINEEYANDVSPWFPWMGPIKPAAKVKAVFKRLPKKEIK